MIKIIQSSSLNPSNLSDIEELLKNCKKKEPITLSFPEIDETTPNKNIDYFYFLYCDTQLISALWFEPDLNNCFECAGFTHPKYRRQGYFSRLLQYVCNLLEQASVSKIDDMDILFISDGNSKDAVGALEHMGYEYWYSETLMEIKATATAIVHPADLKLKIKSKNPDELILILIQNNQCAGSCQISIGEDNIYLYDFIIQESFRNKGLGKAFLNLILDYFSAHNHSNIRLQVTTLNKAAYHLYKSLGFQVIEQIDYYS